MTQQPSARANKVPIYFCFHLDLSHTALGPELIGKACNFNFFLENHVSCVLWDDTSAKS